VTLVPAMGALALGAVISMFAVSGPWCQIRRRACFEPAGRPSSVAPIKVAPEVPDGPTLASPPPPALSPRSLPPQRLTLRTVAARNPPRPHGPQFLGISSLHAGAGHKVAITGRRLKRAAQVLFIGHESGPAAARFVVWDDTRLLVAVPDLGDASQAAAVAIRTEEGVAVMVPAGSALVGLDTTPPQVGPVAVVPSGAAFFGGGGARVVFVEDGATAGAPGLSALFVRRGGRLLDASPDALVFCEDGAVAPSLGRPPGAVIVPTVNPCFVDSLFHYTGR
jgi:hypothetical protein